MNKRILSSADIKSAIDNGTLDTRSFKFVIVGGEIRYTEIDLFSGLNHNQMLKEGEVAEAAGSILYRMVVYS